MNKDIVVIVIMLVESLVAGAAIGYIMGVDKKVPTPTIIDIAAKGVHCTCQ